MRSSRWLLVVLLLTAGVWTTARSEAPPADKKLELYLLIGQSNMAGRGKVAAEDKKPHPRVFKLNKKDEWEPAVDPLHFDKPSAGVGLGLTFGKTLAEANKDAVIGLIPCAAGGSPIAVWKKGATWSQTRSKPYDETLRRVALARKRGELKAILWHQGESDSKEGPAGLYAERLADLVTRLRRDLDADDVPILLGGLSEPLRMRNKNAVIVDQALRAYAKKHPNAAYVNSDGLKLGSDNVHFSAEACREFGRGYAKALEDLK